MFEMAGVDEATAEEPGTGGAHRAADSTKFVPRAGGFLTMPGVIEKTFREAGGGRIAGAAEDLNGDDCPAALSSFGRDERALTAASAKRKKDLARVKHLAAQAAWS